MPRSKLLTVVFALQGMPSIKRRWLNMHMNPFREPLRIGAEIFIEPGQTPEEIDNWFRLMKEHHMTVTRIRMFENCMYDEDIELGPAHPGRTSEGTWDYTLFDHAFRAGEKYGIAIYANLFPATAFSDVGGFKFPKSSENLESIANYISHVVQHFKKFSSLYGWVPINEPGSGEIPIDEFTKSKFEEWRVNRQPLAYDSNGFRTLDFVEQNFLVDYNTWFLEWLCSQIRKYDPVRPIHVNNHDIFKHAAEYDFPAWRSLLSSLGGSAHASWHFGYFNRKHYALAMSANAEMLRSGAGPIPWFMTELQGGNNTYSGKVPMCPTKEEIVQWLWINIGGQSRGAIFWCLNPRRSGFEAGEWALLDFHDGPSDRLQAAAEVSMVVNENYALFDFAEAIEPLITVVYIRESMWIEKALQIEAIDYEGRKAGGVMKSALAYFETFSEMGIHAAFSEIREFDFSKEDYSGKAIVLAHQISIPSSYWKKLEKFVALGGTLLVEGLTAYYDENAYCIVGKSFPFRSVFGATLKEFKMIGELFDVQIDEPGLQLKAHLWKGLLSPVTAEPIAHCGDEVIACRNTYKQGKVVWLPMQLGIGARLTEDYRGLSRLLQHEFHSVLVHFPIRFKEQCNLVLLKVLKSTDSYISIAVNKSQIRQSIELELNNLKEPQLLYKNKNGRVEQDRFVIDPEETLIVKWKS